MFEVKVIGSSSKGNCYMVSDGMTKVLIECGISWHTIQKKLAFKANQLAFCLISHSHKDHSGFAKDIIKAGVDVYCAKETLEEIKLLEHHRTHAVKALEQFSVNTITILPFELEHDKYCLGYLLYSNYIKQRLLFITDSYYCKYKFQSVNTLMIECNYSESIVNENIRNVLLDNVQLRRLLKSHFSLERVKEFLQANDKSNLQQIYLLHLSDRNSNAKKFKEEIEKLTGIPTTIAIER